MDSKSPDLNPNAQPTVDAGGAGNSEAGAGSEAAKAAIELAQLSQLLGREFKDPEDAMKTIKNLNGLVGDRTIADLRKKAETHDTFEKLVSGYAEEEGITADEARKFLADLAKGSGPQQDERVDVMMDKMSKLELQLQEKDFLSDHPEAKSVLKELKVLAAATGQSLTEAYDSSSLKDMLAKAAASEERGRMGNSVRPSAIPGAPNNKVREALERLKTDRSGDSMDRAVATALGL